MAGINAALAVRGETAFTLDRTEAYTGILIDDLISKGTNEPYRMFTSRAEFRLHLRIDNADRRLTPAGRRLGLIDDAAWADYEARQQRAVALEKLLATTRIDPGRVANALPDLNLDSESIAGQTYAQLLKRPEITIEHLRPLLQSLAIASETRSLLDPLLAEATLTARARNELRAVETEIKYAGYLDQQRKSIEKLKRAESLSIPTWFDYQNVSGLSREMQEKLSRVRPQTVGQASRIPGVTPAALSLIHVYIEIQARKRNQALAATDNAVVGS
jgi:tRNA uridine 5-carboxymethylaminomethyl modification enzyme